MRDATVASRITHRLLGDARTELARADEHAASALGAVTALITIVAVAPSGLQPGREIAVRGWVCGLSISALAAVLLLLAALPRFTTGSRRQVIAYFRDVSRIRCERDLGYLLERTTENPDDMLLSELKNISKIVVTKYRLTRLGILCAAAGSSLLLMSAI